MNLRDQVGVNIQRLRREQGLSQEALAHAADISRGYMGKIENGKYAASLDVIEKIAKALDLEPCELLTRQQSVEVEK